ncbi:hypothetical protein FHX82_000975 [Amycolatopsis bartoniae]|uniref:Lipoprotein n=1 Tax=Amycolatopsis bartoniae TaxID=941986 RepID=A0A8H9J7J4_9PSEU|nr:hypothetical protein [Amycolatopsis bartoniae]GHF86337.1 hypothetical protein GCM10017566_70310 [Amycolatopsis bartoniae]
MRAARGPTLLRGFVVAGPASLAAGCVGFSTTGAGGMVFLSTQLRPVAVAETRLLEAQE